MHISTVPKALQAPAAVASTPPSSATDRFPPSKRGRYSGEKRGKGFKPAKTRGKVRSPCLLLLLHVLDYYNYIIVLALAGLISCDKDCLVYHCGLVILIWLGFTSDIAEKEGRKEEGSWVVLRHPCTHVLSGLSASVIPHRDVHL